MNLGGFRSSDGGATWIAYNQAPQDTFGWYVSAVTVLPEPADPPIVYYGGTSITRWRDLGVSDVVFVPHKDHHAFAWDAAGRFLIGNDGGIHRSDGFPYPGAPDSWTSLNDSLSILQCYAGLSVSPTNSEVMLVGNQDNGTVRRHGPELADWDRVETRDGGMTAFPTATVAFASRENVGQIFKSVNAGISFSSSGTGISPGDRDAFHNPFQVDPSDSQRLFLGTQRLYRSTNQGGSWAQISVSNDLTGATGPTPAIRAVAVAPSDGDVIYLATNNYTTTTPSEPAGKMLVSTDGGVNFAETPLNPHPGWRRITREIFVDPTSPQVVYVARARFDDPIGQILRSTNGTSGVMATFQPIDGNTFPEIPVNTIAGHYGGNGIVLYAGTDSGLYYSVNQGSTWYHFSGMPNAIIVDIVVDDPRDRLIIGTQGRGVWSVAVDSPWEFGSPDFNRDGAIDALDPVAFQEGLAKGDPYAIDLDLSTGPKSGDLLDLVAFTGAWTAAAKK